MAERSHNEQDNLKILNRDWFRGSWTSNWQPGRVLDLSDNRIEELPDEAFKNLNGSDFVVELRNNGVKRISARAFEGLKGLKYLNLSENEVGEWSESLVTGAQVVEVVDLSKNKINCLDVSKKELVGNGGNIKIEECK